MVTTRGGGLFVSNAWINDTHLILPRLITSSLQAAIKRNIDDNANYWATARQEAALAAEVAALRSEMAGLGDVAALQARMKRVTEEIQEMMGEVRRVWCDVKGVCACVRLCVCA